ncbi:MAG: glycosyltransferase family protein [Magnetococcales bacterium]|nr:glycosyltransferase family protein [Magnetococcales bacterium]
MMPHRPDHNHLLALSHALTLLAAGRFERAEGIGLRVAGEDGEYADAWFIAGVAAGRQGRHAEAVERLERAIGLQPGVAEYFNNLGVSRNALGLDEEALRDFETALALHPDDYGAHANRARLLLKIGDAQQALLAIRRARALCPGDAELMGDEAVILMAHRELEGALSLYEQALRIAPEDAEIHFNYSRALLMAGRYAEGWRENEWRWRARHYRGVTRAFPAPVWAGEPLAGRRIAMLSEQGFGDALQFIRYAAVLKGLGAEVGVTCRPELTRLFRAARGVDWACEWEHQLPEVDFCIPMWSLPLVLGTGPETIPEARCLTVPPGSFPGVVRQGYRVGLVWSGNNRRDFRFGDLEPLLAVEGVAFHSLQFGPQAVLARERGGVHDWSSHLSDFAVTAALLSQMDLLITIDTAVAHLAGGLGVPFWLFTHVTADWRWGWRGASTPWYPGARLFRQHRRGVWADVVLEMADALRKELADG